MTVLKIYSPQVVTALKTKKVEEGSETLGGKIVTQENVNLSCSMHRLEGTGFEEITMNYVFQEMFALNCSV